MPMVVFWLPNLFTPFKEGTADFEEWNDDNERTLPENNLQLLQDSMDRKEENALASHGNFDFILHTDESLENEGMEELHKSMKEIMQISDQMQDELQEQSGKLETIALNVESANETLETGLLSQKNALKGASIALMMGGVLVGGAIAGPVGVAVGGYAGATLGAGAIVGCWIIDGNAWVRCHF